MNYQKLKSRIVASGLKLTYVASQCGLTYPGWFKKAKGDSEFRASEIKVMSDLMRLTPKEVMDIFLSEC